MISNSTVISDLPPLPTYSLRPLPRLVGPISDEHLLLILPIAVYWTGGLFFHWINTKGYWAQYAIHTPAEFLKRNRVSPADAVKNVLTQQFLQVALGAFFSMGSEEPLYGKEDYEVAQWARSIRLAQRMLPGLFSVVGIDSGTLAKRIAPSHPTLAGALAGGRYPGLTQTVSSATGMGTVAPAFARWELFLASAMYYYVIPALQFAVVMAWNDSWQYFWHRFFHQNKWFYNHVHKFHHRVYVPYCFAALYNHPAETIIVDIIGVSLSFMISGLTTRQAMCFLVLSTMKALDDHCGYSLPFDPFRYITGLDTYYHDVHHQNWGMKVYFTFWDDVLGTAWKGETDEKYERGRAAAQRLVDMDKGIGSSKHGDTNDAEDAPNGKILSAGGSDGNE